MLRNSRIKVSQVEAILDELLRADRAKYDILDGKSEFLKDGEDPYRYYGLLASVDVNKSGALLYIVMDILGLAPAFKRQVADVWVNDVVQGDMPVSEFIRFVTGQ